MIFVQDEVPGEIMIVRFTFKKKGLRLNQLAYFRVATTKRSTGSGFHMWAALRGATGFYTKKKKLELSINANQTSQAVTFWFAGAGTQLGGMEYVSNQLPPLRPAAPPVGFSPKLELGCSAFRQGEISHLHTELVRMGGGGDEATDLLAIKSIG